MIGDVTINGYDAYTRWGINFEDGAISTLLTYSELKDFVENESRLLHGKSVILNSPKFASREIVLPFHLLARNWEDFLDKYGRFNQEVVANAKMDVITKHQKGVVFHLIYRSCNQFQQYNGQMAVFTLKVEEPDPTNRV